MTEAPLYTYVLFFTSNHAFRAEKLLKQAGMDCKLVPVPRQFSSECGVCLRIEHDIQSLVETHLASTQVEVDSFQSA